MPNHFSKSFTYRSFRELTKLRNLESRLMQIFVQKFYFIPLMTIQCDVFTDAVSYNVSLLFLDNVDILSANNYKVICSSSSKMNENSHFREN